MLEPTPTLSSTCLEFAGGLIVFLGLLSIVASIKGNSDAKAAAVDETRTAIVADLETADIPAFEGDFYFQLITFTDVLHPSRPTIRDFEILGVESTDEAEIYHLIDTDGYISTLSFASSGLPTWQPDVKPGATEPEINPSYQIAARHFIEGDFSVRFINTENTEDAETVEDTKTSTPVRPEGAAANTGPVVP